MSIRGLSERLKLILLTAALSVMLVGMAGVRAQAEQTPANDATASTTKSLVLGGTTQSVDPTRYDYVAPGGAGGGIRPMSATGYGWVPAFTYSWNGLQIPVPSGYILHVLKGSGLTVNVDAAQYEPNILGIQICNYRFAFQNRYGKTIYATRWAPLHAGCTYGYFSQGVVGPFTVRTGVDCARLYVNGIYRGEQCHNVYP